MLEKYHRHSSRLSKLDYRLPNKYFVTVCAHKHGCYFDKYPETHQIVEQNIVLIPEQFKSVAVPSYVVMPNHVHLIIEIKPTVGASFMKPKISLTKSCTHMQTSKELPTLGQIVRYFKAKSSYQIHHLVNINPIWQRNYFERRIRNAIELQKFSRYIALNPQHWEQDAYHPKVLEGRGFIYEAL